MVVPHTACPILFGLRSTDRSILPRAFRAISSEPVERWLVFRTNQASGDHLTPRTASALGPFESAILTGRVVSEPRVLPGGHVRFEFSDGEDLSVTCLAFEPTKTLPEVARRLRVGDRLTVWGGQGAGPGFRLEGLRIRALVPRFAPPRPPVCPGCHRPSESHGAGRGYRCRGCHRRFPPESGRGRPVPADLSVGTYQPTPSARRHLAALRELPSHIAGRRDL